MRTADHIAQVEALLNGGLHKEAQAALYEVYGSRTALCHLNLVKKHLRVYPDGMIGELNATGPNKQTTIVAKINELFQCLPRT